MNPLKTRYSGASGTWGEKLRFEYDWNPRDQMERVDKFVNGVGIPVGYVIYRYCLSCDGALSEREEHGAYSGGSHPIVSWQRYEYHGLDLARVDERYDSNSSGTITSADAWRSLEVSSHRPGAIGSLLGKRVYTHTNNDATPDTTKNFFYTYDPVGDVVSVMDDSGDEIYFFTQEAFGNELPVSILGGSDWDNAADDRIMEHQTGKWRDEFTGLYYFWGRWYEPEIGRFMKKDPSRQHPVPYQFNFDNPVSYVDPSGYECLLHGSKRVEDYGAIHLKQCCPTGKEQEGKNVYLVFPPGPRPDRTDGHRHNGYSIPIGTYGIYADQSRMWYRLYDLGDESSATAGNWRIRDDRFSPPYDYWTGVSIHSGSYSLGCWTLSADGYKKVQACCGQVDSGKRTVGKFKAVNTILGPSDPLWPGWQQKLGDKGL